MVYMRRYLKWLEPEQHHKSGIVLLKMLRVKAKKMTQENSIVVKQNCSYCIPCCYMLSNCYFAGNIVRYSVEVVVQQEISKSLLNTLNIPPKAI